MQADIGLVGLAVMGENLVLNMEEKGFTVAVYNRTHSVVEKFVNGRGAGKKIIGAKTMADFVKSLKKPRKVMIMVKAGAPVDAVINEVLPLLEKGDLITDGGNSLFTDTQRRVKELEPKGIHYMGSGVSGGEEGARHGPSIMPGGSKEAWEIVKPIFTKISAQVEGEACCRYMGTDGAGNYVKTIHNGIEYGDMQLICEAYDILRTVLGMSAKDMQGVFADWNKGELDSFLIEVTSHVLGAKDEKTGGALVDMVLDKAGQKGTGKWTLQSATELGVVASTINAAVEARILSALKDQRVAASKILHGPKDVKFEGDKDTLVKSVHDALYASKIISYAQGFALFGRAAQEYGWKLNFGDIATIWRGGCIIRARFLNRIKEAYDRNPNLENLMLDPFFTSVLDRAQSGWRYAVATAVQHGVAVPAFGASLAYFDSYRRESLPTNLLQAQRDYFGAHTYERTDALGTFVHTEWPHSL